jgi:hypothetical protein
MVLGRFADDPLRMEKARNKVCEKLHWESADRRNIHIFAVLPF